MTDAADITGQRNEFTTAFNMVVPPAAPKPDDPLPHYPSPRYVDQNLAPEKTLTYRDVAALGQARREAEKAGVLTPELGAQLLPMAMVEGHSGNFGVKADNAFYAGPGTVDRFKKMGLTITDITDPAEVAARKWDIAKADPTTGELRYYQKVGGRDTPSQDSEGNTIHPILREINPPPWGDLTLGHAEGGGKMLQIGGFDGPPGMGPDQTLTNARMMAAVLAEKAAADPTKTVDGAVKRYNGYGKSVEHDGGQYIPANVDTYLAKVKTAAAMLDHPYNKALVDHFNAAYKSK